MEMNKALEKVSEYMVRNAKAVSAQMTADGLVPSYRAKAHSAAAGRIMSHLLLNGEDEVEGNAANMTVLFHSLANHSAWRQKFEGMGIFPRSETAVAKDPAKAQDKVAKLMAELEKASGGGATIEVAKPAPTPAPTENPAPEDLEDTEA